MDSITISRMARLRQQETLEKYVMGKSGGPIEEWLWQAGASLIATGRKILGRLVSARSREVGVLMGTPSRSRPDCGDGDPCVKLGRSAVFKN